MDNQQTKEIGFQIKRVKDVSFVINESLYVPDPQKLIKVEINQSFGSNIEKRLINFTILLQLKYETAPPNEVLANIAVQNIFEVAELENFIKDDGTLELPVAFLISIVGIALSHGRALFSKNLGGTVFQDTLIPILNPADVTNHFFPLPPNKHSVNFTPGDQGIYIAAQQ